MKPDRDEGFYFQQKMIIEKPLKEVFGFFSNAENLQRITPPKLQFKILTSLPVSMTKGTLIDYQIKLFKVPFKWKTEITEWNPPYRFIDIQRKGPYRQWIHTHKFEQTEHGVLVTDMVHYKLWGSVFNGLINRWFVRPQVSNIFEFRRRALSNIFHNEYGAE